MVVVWEGSVVFLESFEVEFLVFVCLDFDGVWVYGVEEYDSCYLSL